MSNAYSKTDNFAANAALPCLVDNSLNFVWTSLLNTVLDFSYSKFYFRHSWELCHARFYPFVIFIIDIPITSRVLEGSLSATFKGAKGKLSIFGGKHYVFQSCGLHWSQGERQIDFELFAPSRQFFCDSDL